MKVINPKMIIMLFLKGLKYYIFKNVFLKLLRHKMFNEFKSKNQMIKWNLEKNIN